MKLSKLLVLGLLSTLLIGCGVKGKTSSASVSSSASEISEVSSSTSAPTSSTPVSSEEPSSSEPSSSEPEVVVHAQDEIESDIATALSSAVGAELSFKDSGQGYHYLGLNFGTDEAYVDNAGEAICKSAVSTLETFLPAYLVSYSAHFYDGTSEEEDYWGDGDGSTCYVAQFLNEDASVLVFIQGYCYNSKLLGYINVASLA